MLDWQANGAIASRVAFDLVAANILAGPLQQLAEHFCDVLRPGGQVVLSGILPEQTGEVMAAYALIDFAEPVIEDGWACLVGIKQN